MTWALVILPCRTRRPKSPRHIWTNSQRKALDSRTRTVHRESAHPAAKRDIWEGGHRVPFIIRWPGMVSPGKVNDGLLSQIDVYSTLATIVGADIPADSGEDSSNQLPFMVLLGI